eukprot:TRINITY_DN915_c0_g2_i1.p1 TRINITY_DN915_c0_g2~~TRINITY_DN915_c0_g2_i1.p1  ORF type:complete len:454 (+),score=148.98 TRINITY_DN915_c0_g2_i1:71-1432(+)
MCIRDRYQRRVHGDNNIFAGMNKGAVVILALAALCVFVGAQDVSPKKNVSELFTCNQGSQDVFSGYLQVRDTGSALFYQLFAPINDTIDSTHPIIVWFEGGPGQASLFNDITPCRPNANGELFYNQYTWSTDYFVLLIDQPLGTGFSYRAEADAPVTSSDVNSQDLIVFFEKFFEQYPNLKTNKRFFWGEGYAGHTMTNFLANVFLKDPEFRVDGITLGNPWLDAKSQMNWDEFGFVVGLLDTKTRDEIRALQTQARLHILNDNNKEAARVITVIRQRLQELDDQVSLNNFQSFHLMFKDDRDSAYTKWVQNPERLKKLGAHPKVDFLYFRRQIQDDFADDFTSSSIYDLSASLMDKRLMVYCGQNDYFTNCGGIMNAVKNIKSYIADWHGARTTLWKHNGATWGNVKVIHKGKSTLYFVVVYNSGHFVTANVPIKARIMRDKFFLNSRDWTS